MEGLSFVEAGFYGGVILRSRVNMSIVNDYLNVSTYCKRATAAVKDFLNAPRINKIDVSHYTVQPDSYLRAMHDFELKIIKTIIKQINRFFKMD